MNAKFSKIMFILVIVTLLLSACGDDEPKVYKLSEGNYAACSQGYKHTDVTTWGDGTLADSLTGICGEAAYKAANGYTVMVGDKVIYPLSTAK